MEMRCFHYLMCFMLLLCVGSARAWIVEPGSFQIYVNSTNASSTVQFILFYNDFDFVAWGSEPIIWAAGEIGPSPSAWDVTLTGNKALTAILSLGDSEYESEGPIAVPNNTYWVASVNAEEEVSIREDASPHKNPAAGIQVSVNQPLTLVLSTDPLSPNEGPSVQLVYATVPQSILFSPITSLTILSVVVDGDVRGYIGKPVSSLPAIAMVYNTSFTVTPATDAAYYYVELYWEASTMSFYPKYGWDYNY